VCLARATLPLKNFLVGMPRAQAGRGVTWLGFFSYSGVSKQLLQRCFKAAAAIKGGKSTDGTYKGRHVDAQLHSDGQIHRHVQTKHLSKQHEPV
jgi:hypothetical protein